MLGLGVAFVTYRLRRRNAPVVFPFLHRAAMTVAPIRAGQRLAPAEVLALLPGDRAGIEAVVATATQVAQGRAVAFVHHGANVRESHAAPLEVADPYLEDREAQSVFARAEREARRTISDRRYVYVPGNLRREAVGDVWRRIQPRETLVAEGGHDVLPPIAVDRVRRTHSGGVTVLHLISRKPLPVPVAG